MCEVNIRELALDEIKEFAGRNGVKKVAVENFLMSMGTDANIAEKNLDYDAGLYKWNVTTQSAIRDGINLAKR